MTAHIDGQAVRSRQLAIGTIGDREITAIEAIGGSAVGRRVQQAWLDLEYQVLKG